jgi:hypothetical protein
MSASAATMRSAQSRTVCFYDFGVRRAIPVQQTIGNLSAATKTLETLVLQGRLRHGRKSDP